MATTCPKCSTKLKDDYGMVTCPTCGVVLFVDMEGVAQAAGEPEAAALPVEPESMLGGHAPVEPVGLDSPLFDLPSFELSAADKPTSDDQAGDNIAAPELFSGTEPLAVPEENSGRELDMGEFLGYSPKDSDTSGATSSQLDPNDPLGISAYANSELSSAKDGPLVVTVIISGIDTKDLRGEIRQALQDSRFGWDAGALMASIKGGILSLPRISPVKASIVINRIKNLAVQIRWEQNAITELDISPNDSTS